MKKFFEVNTDQISIDMALLIARVGIAGFMLTHGLPKLMMLLGDAPVQFPGVMGMGPEFSLFLTVFAEVICSVLILIGLGTRFAAIPLIFTMVVAVFYIHAADPFANQEMGLHYLLVYVLLFLLGSGKFSLDAVVVDKHSPNLESPRY